MFKVVTKSGDTLCQMAIDAICDADWRRDFDKYADRFFIVAE